MFARAAADGIARVHGLVTQDGELRLSLVRVLREAQLELGVGDLQLALVRVAQLGAGLQVVGRDSELSREHPQCLDRRPPRARLDARDVGVRDAWACELALGEAALMAQASQPLADRLGLPS